MKGTKANADIEEWDIVGLAPVGWEGPSSVTNAKKKVKKLVLSGASPANEKANFNLSHDGVRPCDAQQAMANHLMQETMLGSST